MVPILVWLIARRDVDGSPPPDRGDVSHLAIVLGPVAIRDLVVSGQFALTTSQFGPKLYIGNNPGADGTYHALTPWHGGANSGRRDATALAERTVGRPLSPSGNLGYLHPWRPPVHHRAAGPRAALLGRKCCSR